MLAQVDGWDVFWNVLFFFFLFMWVMVFFQVVMDLFRDHETSGWAKAGWVVFMIFLPFLGVLVYLIARGPGMARRQAAQAAQAEQDFKSYVQQAAGAPGAGPADQIARGKELLESGAITQEEFDQLKARALA